MAIILIPAVFDVIALRILGLEAAIAELTYEATFALLPWPAMIGIRRFYQGLMIRRGYTINVSYGTAIRLLSMFSTVYGLYYFAVPTKRGPPLVPWACRWRYRQRPWPPT